MLLGNATVMTSRNVNKQPHHRSDIVPVASGRTAIGHSFDRAAMFPIATVQVADSECRS